MSHSNSSLNTFASCMKRYEHQYILHTAPCKPPSPHLQFGVMAHDVLHKAGLLRDESADGVVDKDKCYEVIPSDVLYPELQAEFDIKSWNGYFTPVIKQTAEYEQELMQMLLQEKDEPIYIDRELKLQLTPDDLLKMGYPGIKQPLVGIIDLLIRTPTRAIIMDYKFSTTRKTQNDFDMNSQLPIYAMLVNHEYNIPVHNIRYGYIDIPKKSFETPILLSNGTLSRSKAQNVSQEMYKKSVEAVHGVGNPKYNCDPGGYYYDCWCNMALNKAAYMSVQYLDEEAYESITKDILNAAKMVDYFIDNKLVFLKKYDAYSCANCEFVNSCKPWITVNWE